LDRLDFCPVSLGRDLKVAPLKVGGPVDLGLVGLGAVGTAVARILGGLGFERASALLIDPETFAIENLGTYSLGTLADIGVPKVELAAAALEGWSLRLLSGPVEDAIAPVDAGSLPWPRTMICGLDSIEARRAAQGLWPDRLIDGATGDTAVGLHEAMTTGACMRCFFPDRIPARSAAQLLSEEIGLPVELLTQGDERLEEKELAELTERQRERLTPHIGKPICGLASAVGLGGAKDDTYMPSVPFVSQQAACLAVGRLLARRTGMVELPNTVQYNAMLGPLRMTKMTRPPRPGCYCQERADVIRMVRHERSGRLLSVGREGRTRTTRSP
jgi:molybdopterin/thiamine biosynthesis adenylyltransferase